MLHRDFGLGLQLMRARLVCAFGLQRWGCFGHMIYSGLWSSGDWQRACPCIDAGLVCMDRRCRRVSYVEKHLTQTVHLTMQFESLT